MKGIPTFSFFGWSANTEQSKFYIIFLVCAAATGLVVLLFRSPLGRAFMAIRDNEMAADSMGINALLTKSIAFAISGALCGAAGALYAYLSGYTVSNTPLRAHETGRTIVCSHLLEKKKGVG